MALNIVFPTGETTIWKTVYWSRYLLQNDGNAPYLVQKWRPLNELTFSYTSWGIPVEVSAKIPISTGETTNWKKSTMDPLNIYCYPNFMLHGVMMSFTFSFQQFRFLNMQITDECQIKKPYHQLSEPNKRLQWFYFRLP